MLISIMWDHFKSHILCVDNEWLDRDSGGITTVCLIAQSHYAVLSWKRLHSSHICRFKCSYQMFARPTLGTRCRYESFTSINSKLPLIKTTKCIFSIIFELLFDSKSKFTWAHCWRAQNWPIQSWWSVWARTAQWWTRPVCCTRSACTRPYSRRVCDWDCWLRDWS